MNSLDLFQAIKPAITIFSLFLVVVFFISVFQILITKQAKSNQYKNQIKDYNMTAKQIGESLDKTPQEINKIFLEMEYIKKDEKGYKATEKGKQKGAIDKFYMGNNYVCWDDKILQDELLLKMINPPQEQPQEQEFRKKFEANLRTKSGHFVRSRAEAMIADYLYSENICFAYEKRLPIIEDVYCDFYIPQNKIYIEFWGYEDDEKYIKRKETKQKIYQENNFNLIQIDNNTINQLDDFLPRELLKFGLLIQ